MFSADTECARLMRDLDWSGSALGPPENWPVELRTLVAVMLGSEQPMFVVWGPEQIILYNDAYGVLCGARHPAMGVPFRTLWFDIMDEVEPILQAAYNGQSTHVSDMAFVMHRNGYPEEAYFSFSYTPVPGAMHEVLGMFCVCAETTDQVFSRRAEEHERELLYQTLRLSPGATALLLGPDHVFTFANERYLALIARGAEIIGMRVVEALPEVVGQGFIELLDRVYTTGEPYIGRDVEIDLISISGPGAPLKRFALDFVYQPFSDEKGERRGVLVQAIDVTDRRERERRQGIITTELAHRMRNQLAVVRAIVSQTLRSASEVREAAQTIDGRLMALSRAQQLLLSGASEEGSVESVVRVALAAYGEGEPAPYRLSGPHVVLNPQLVMSLALVLHELGTNALKYGAFSTPGGKVSITWDVDGEGRFVFDWRETGGPAVAPPLRRGAGSRLIAAGLDTFDGEVRMDFEPEGLHCRMITILPHNSRL